MSQMRSCGKVSENWSAPIAKDFASRGNKEKKEASESNGKSGKIGIIGKIGKRKSF